MDKVDVELSRRLAAVTGARDGQCWNNALDTMTRLVGKESKPDCLYVEGFAVIANGEPREHAWIELDGRIVDTTPVYTDPHSLGFVKYFSALRYTFQKMIETLYGESAVMAWGVPPLGLRFGGRDTAEYKAALHAAIDSTVARQGAF